MILLFSISFRTNAQLNDIPKGLVDQIDSLNQFLKPGTHDTLKAAALLDVSSILITIIPDTVPTLCNKSLSIIENGLLNAYTKVRLSLKKSKWGNLNNLGVYYVGKGLYNEALNYYLKSVELQNEINDPESIGLSYNNIGYAYMNLGEIPKAIKYYNLSLKTHEKINNLPGIAMALGNLAYQYQMLGDIAKAIELNHECLKIKEKVLRSSKSASKISDAKKGLATTFNNLGVIYKDQGEYALALEYYEKSLRLEEEIKNKAGMASSYNNIGNFYKTIGIPNCNKSKEECKKESLKRSFEYYNKSLELHTANGNKQGIGMALNNIAFNYQESGDINCIGTENQCKSEGLQKALVLHRRVLKLREEIGDKQKISTTLNNLAFCLLKLEQYEAALDTGLLSLQKAKEIGYPERILAPASTLKKIYAKLGMHEKALEMYELHISLKDSISNESNKKAANKQQLKYEFEKKEAQIRAEQEQQELIYEEEQRRTAMRFEFESAQQKLSSEKEKQEIFYLENAKRNKLAAEFEKKKAVQRAEQEKLNAIHKEEKQQQQIIILATIIGLIMIAVFALFVVNRLKLTRKQKATIEKQKKVVDEAFYMLHEKNKEVMDSIHYAARIQRSLITSEKYIRKQLNKNR